MNTKAQKQPAKEVEKFAEDIKFRMDEGADRVARGVADYAAFAKDTASAWAKSAGVASKAAEKINAETLALASEMVRAGITVAKEAGASKNFAEMFELQASYAAKTCGETVAKAAAVNDVARGAMENAIETVSDRMVAFADLTKVQRI